jgi:uncharacterized protein YndB with AHSA1/START domain
MAERAVEAPIVVESVLPHKAAKLWRVLTEPALLRGWLMEGDFSAVAGNRSTLHGRPGHWPGSVACEVEEVEVPLRLRVRWRGAPGAPHGRDTRVTWTLASADGGTRLRMEHSGFGADETAGREEASRTWQRSLELFATVSEWLQA